MAPDLQSLLPLPVNDLYILLALLDQPRHGYAIIQDVAERTSGRTRMGTSTVYAALKRMRTAGMIAETSRPAGVRSEDERRRYYRATKFGRDVARAAAQDIERLFRTVKGARLVDLWPSSPARYRP